MCGILGSVNIEFGEPALELIRHRGPDDFGIDSFTVNNNNIKFAQRRLSIIDLSPAGHQPMNSACGNYSLIFNGEVYNHLELRKKLPSTIQYNGHSDTETIFNYLMCFGIDAIADFNGIFAIAFLDVKKQSLFIARDPFGVKPFYYFKQGNELVFSSEIRPIKSLLGGCTLNNDALASLLRLRFNASPDTLYTEINKLKPGHYMSFSLCDGELNGIEKYFGAIDSNVKLIQKGADLVKLYGEELESAVKRQLLSDVDIGILLSGGIDSAVVAALAKKHYQGELKAFTIGFDGEYEEDEIGDAAHTAKLLGLKHYVKRITFSNFLEIVKECTRIVEEPLATTSIIPMYYLSKLASEEVKVVLTGQGADEPLGGYARYKSELYRNIIPTFGRKLIKPVVRLLNVKNEQILRGANAIGVEDQIKRFLSVYEIFSEEEVYDLVSMHDSLSEIRLSYLSSLLDISDEKHSAEKMMAVDTRMSLSDDLLNYTDKVTMNFSLECRVPMLDHDLIKLVEALPVNSKLNSKGGKIIHKEFARTLLPEEIINRPKKGFQSPTKRWFLDEMATLKAILLSEETLFSKVFNQTCIEGILDQHVSGYNKEKQIFLLLSIYYWVEDNRSINISSNSC